MLPPSLCELRRPLCPPYDTEIAVFALTPATAVAITALPRVALDIGPLYLLVADELMLHPWIG
ncbi:hypothetical protein XI06_12205 [Bradyrhizobium sp. CCBAU 11434]|nr:hypothetical protein [Bradyrhizobium sp. CCBAU 11434]